MRSGLKDHLRFPHHFALLLLVVALFSLALAGPVSASAKPSKPPALIGIRIAALSPALAEDIGLPTDLKGVLVLGVHEGSPAQAVGLQPGDVIVEVTDAKGKPVGVADLEKYQSVVDAVPADQPLTLKVLRANQEMTVAIRRSSNPLGPLMQPPKSQAPQTLKVAPDGSGDVKTLDGAFLRARPGDTILLQGTWGVADVWRSEVTLASLDPTHPATLAGLRVSAVPGVRLRGLSVVAPPSTKQTAGIQLQHAPGASVEECYVKGFETGISVISSSNVTLAGNTITGNGCGISIFAQSEVRVNRNLIFKNALRSDSPVAGGITVWDSQVEISHNTILDNSLSPDEFPAVLHSKTLYSPDPPGVGIKLWWGTTALVFNNIVGQNNIGILVNPDCQATIEYNDVYGHFIQSKVWSPKMFVEVRVAGGNANYLSGIRYESVMAPAFSLEPYRHLYTPFLQFTPSQTNLSVDPLFADPLKGDYHLAADSPLAGKGRGGTYIGAYAPVGQPAPQIAASAPSAVSEQATTLTPAPAAAAQATTGVPPGAWISGQTLYIQPEVADRLLNLLKQRVEAEPALKERVTQAATGVVPFTLVDLPEIELSRDFTETFLTSLINNRFRPADQVQLEKAMQELKIRDSSQVSQEATRELCRRAGCGFLLVGSISDRGQIVLLNVRLLEAETGVPVVAERLEVAKRTP